MKVVIKVARKEVMKKRTPLIDSFSNSNNEVSLPPSKEKLYIVLEVGSKMTNNLLALQKSNDRFLTQLCLSPFIYFPFLVHFLIRFLCFFKLFELFKTARYHCFCT